MKRLRTIGEGSYGVVYEVEYNGNKYAYKRNKIDEEVSFWGSIRELDLHNKMKSHPYIAKLENVCHGNVFIDHPMSPIKDESKCPLKDDKIHFLMELGDGNLKDYYSKTPIFDYGQMKIIMMQLLLGLEYMHSKGIVHRDIGPNNILFFRKKTADGKGEIMVKICDLGLSKPMCNQAPSSPRVITRWYRAPEICLGQQCTSSSDIWSLGITIGELVRCSPLITVGSEEGQCIIESILETLGSVLPQEDIAYVKQCSYLNRNIRPRYANYNDILRMNTVEKLNFFNSSPGNYEQFIDLLSHMLVVQPDRRWTATQLLNHPFFSQNQIYSECINNVRVTWPVEAFKLKETYCYISHERYWGMERARWFHGSRHYFSGWYSHRILFQALDIYDRYLEYKSKCQPVYKYTTNTCGYYLNCHEANIAFNVCMYIAIKYFNTNYVNSFQKMLGFDFTMWTQQSKNDLISRAGGLEIEIITYALQYDIYRDTCYEIADRKNIKVEGDVALRILNIYCNWNMSHINGDLVMKQYSSMA